MICCDKCGTELHTMAEVYEQNQEVLYLSDYKIHHLCDRCHSLLCMILNEGIEKIVSKLKKRAIRQFLLGDKRTPKERPVPVSVETPPPADNHLWIPVTRTVETEEEPLELGEPDKINPADIPPSASREPEMVPGGRDAEGGKIERVLVPKESAFDKLLKRLPGVR